MGCVKSEWKRERKEKERYYTKLEWSKRVEAVDENVNERELRGIILSNLTNQTFSMVLPTKVSIFYFSFLFVFLNER